MTVQEFEEMANILRFKYRMASTGSPSWRRAFILRSDGASVGRFSFKDGRVAFIKNYKRSHFEGLDETDFIFLRIHRYMKDGVAISADLYSDLIITAKHHRQQDLEEKEAWRRAHPKRNPDGTEKRRKRLHGRNLRHVLAELVMEARP